MEFAYIIIFVNHPTIYLSKYTLMGRRGFFSVKKREKGPNTLNISFPICLKENVAFGCFLKGLGIGRIKFSM